MSTTATLHDLMAIRPEHPAPHPGNVVHLSYPAIDGSVAVEVQTDPAGYARFTVNAPAAEADRSLDVSRRAVTRMTGNDPDAPDGVERARASMGRTAFDANVELLARQRLLSLAVMRTGIFPFLQPEYPAGDKLEPGRDFAFEATFRLRPFSDLTGYDPVELSFPPKPKASERQIEDRLSQLMGGQIRWLEVPEDALKGLEKIRATVREQVEKELENEWYSQLMTACSDVLCERLVTQPRVQYIAALRDELASRYATAVEAGGQRWNDYIATPGFDLDVFKEQMTSEALVALRRGLALDAVAEHEGIVLTDGDIMECLTGIAPGNEVQAAQTMIDNGQLPQLVESARRAKAGDWVASRAIDLSTHPAS